MSHHYIHIENLSYTYPDNTKALENISFKVKHGESIAIIGANGAGKSTLLLHFNGCLLPQKGSINIGDRKVLKETVKDIRKTVGMLFQNSDDQLFMPTVYDDVAFGPLNLNLPHDEVEKRVIKALHKTGIIHLKDRPPYKLSVGEKRLVTIAAVLSIKPNILVMDEPTDSLDPFARRNIINLLKTFKHTKVIASHDLDMVLDLCERTIILNKGQLIADGLTKKLLNDGKLLNQNHLEKPLSLQGCPICSKRKVL